MSATVACTRSVRPEATTGRCAVRVTHTLLFLAAAAVPPGVCDACPACPTRAERSDSRSGLPDHAAGSRQEGIAAAVAGSHCCGSCARTLPCMPTGRSPADRMPPGSVADAGDGAPSSCDSCADDCRCLLEPRGSHREAIPGGANRGPDDDTVAVADWWPSDTAAPTPAAGIPRPPEDRPPDRPVRVLYGVWRN